MSNPPSIWDWNLCSETELQRHVGGSDKHRFFLKLGMSGVAVCLFKKHIDACTILMPIRKREERPDFWPGSAAQPMSFGTVCIRGDPSGFWLCP